MRPTSPVLGPGRQAVNIDLLTIYFCLQPALFPQSIDSGLGQWGRVYFLRFLLLTLYPFLVSI